MVFFDTVTVPRVTLEMSPHELASFGFEQDDPEDLVRFRPRAEAATLGNTSDIERIINLSNAIYALSEPGAPVLGPYDAITLSSVADAIEGGRAGQCGHLTWMLTGLARSIGLDVRQTLWAKDDGTVGHVSMEFYARDERRWIYFDLNFRGYATGADGRALSAASLRALTPRAPGVSLVSHASHRAWTAEQFAAEHARYAFDWYMMSNRLHDFEPEHRFGILNGAHGALTQLPFAAQRVADVLLTGRQTRLALDRHAVSAGGTSVRALHTLFGYLLMAAMACFGCAVIDKLAGRGMMNPAREVG